MAEGAFIRKEVYSTGDVAKLCNLSLQTIIRCFDSGEIKGFRIPGSRFRRIPHGSLVDFMRRHNIPSANGVEREDTEEVGLSRVLIVDDDDALVEMLSEFITETGEFEVHVARTGFQAGLDIRRLKPDVILLDVMLPDINGREVLTAVREDPELRACRVIAISGLIEEDKVKELYEAGADLFIHKPFDLNDLLASVRKTAGGNGASAKTSAGHE